MVLPQLDIGGSSFHCQRQEYVNKCFPMDYKTEFKTNADKSTQEHLIKNSNTAPRTMLADNKLEECIVRSERSIRQNEQPNSELYTLFGNNTSQEFQSESEDSAACSAESWHSVSNQDVKQPDQSNEPNRGSISLFKALAFQIYQNQDNYTEITAALQKWIV